jgi:hypothetical protein
LVWADGKNQQTKNQMKNSYKAALLAALGLISISAAQAQSYNDGSGANAPGDLIVGVYDPAVSQTDVIDIGSQSALYNNESWSLSTLGLAGAGFSSTLSSTAQFGVVGDLAGTKTIPSQLYLTTTGLVPNSLPSRTAYAQVDSYMGEVALGAQTVNSGNDWLSQTTVAPQNGSTTMGATLGLNVNATVGTGEGELWTVLSDGSAPTLIGSFSLDPSTEVLTFNEVPEPSTMGLLGGAGVLLLAFRNKLGRKQA